MHFLWPDEREESSTFLYTWGPFSRVLGVTERPVCTLTRCCFGKAAFQCVRTLGDVSDLTFYLLLL